MQAPCIANPTQGDWTGTCVGELDIIDGNTQVGQHIGQDTGKRA